MRHASEVIYVVPLLFDWIRSRASPARQIAGK